jgi:hypothetical protein
LLEVLYLCVGKARGEVAEENICVLGRHEVRLLRRIFEYRGEEVESDGESFVMMSFMTSTLHQMLLV